MTSALDKVIGFLSPRWALKRAQAAIALDAVRAYDATKPSRYRRGAPMSEGPNTSQLSIPALRDLARELEQNSDLARTVRNVLVGRIVGRGLTPEPLVRRANGEPATEVNEMILTYWRQWIERPDVTGQFHYHRLQRLLCSRWIVDGEVLKKRLLGERDNLQHGSAVPFSVEAIEADFLPYDFDDFNGRIRAGVEHNGWGRPIRYHLYRSHPNESRSIRGVWQDQLTAWPAQMIDHIKLVDRIGQVRGVSQFAPVIPRLDDLKDIDEAERVATRAAAMLAIAIRRGDPQSYGELASGQSAEKTRSEIKLEPGMVIDDLLPGEDISVISGSRPNQALIPFRADMIRGIAGGTQVAYSAASKNYNGTYSAQRQEMVESHEDYAMLWHDFMTQAVLPDYRDFITAARAAQLIPGDGYDPATLRNVSFSRPTMPWIDPKKEADGMVTLVSAGLESPQTIIRNRGQNPEDVIASLKEWAEKTAGLNLEINLSEESDDEEEASASSDAGA